MSRKGFVTIVVVLFWCCQCAQAQSLLNKNIAIDIRQQRLDHVLEIISNKGNFYFSYSSNIIKKDSLVSISANKTVGQILGQLLPDYYEFRESGNYIIIRKQPIKLTVVTNKAATADRFYMVSGYVLDEHTANWIENATVYEKSLLASTMTNANGYFRLKLKHKGRGATLTVSKEFYEDTSFAIDPGYNQEISVTLLPVTTGSVTIIGPEDYFAPEQLKLRVKQNDSSVVEYTYTKVDSVQVERTGMGKFLLSSRQQLQSLNLRKFFTTRPFQLSVAPGLSTHGQMAPQVVNNFSLNVFGGYNAGVEGVEIGGIFNIDKKDVKYMQAAGIFNIVGGKMEGFQVAGVTNTVLDSSKGFQVAGVNNMVTGKFHGFQASGVYNHVTDSVRGVQIAGVGNFAKERVSGTQISGFMNFGNRQVGGVQISLINYAKHLKGVQVGLINIADTSEGVSIGLINIVVKGYHKLAFYADEVVNANAAFKTGNRKLYSILHAGMNFSDSNEIFTFGYGLGTEVRIGKVLSLNPELAAQHLYLGSWDYANILSKARLNLNVRLTRHLTVFGGPVYNVYYSEQDVHFPGYRKTIPPAGYKTHSYTDFVKGWLGWNAGISFF